MCGIAGLFSFGAAAPPDKGELARMIGALHHRGPDGSATFVDGPVGLAHARLSIIDLATGWQPIANEDESLQVVFNGEIFNFVELRAGLERRGHRFRTHSDTEVIVHLYEERGDDFVDELNGQFAIALWDRRRRRLVLARDRTGIRPLFYAHDRGRLAFASEVKALFTLPGVTRRLDAAGLAGTFSYWAPLAPARSSRASPACRRGTAWSSTMPARAPSATGTGRFPSSRRPCPRRTSAPRSCAPC